MDWDPTTEEICHNWILREREGKNRHVTINRGRRDQFAAEFPLALTKDFYWHDPGVYPEDDWAFAGYMPLIGACNFHQTSPRLAEGIYTVSNPANPDKPYRGARAMCRRFYEKFGERIPTVADIAPLVESGIPGVVRFFMAVNDLPLPELRYLCLGDYVAGLTIYFEGDPMAIFEEATVGGLCAFGNGKGLVELLVKRFPLAFGGDVHCDEDGRRYPFYKKAKLVAYMLHGRALESHGENIPLVRDIHAVGPLAENQMARILRYKGVLKYSQELDYMIEKRIHIPNNSSWYLEIRAGTTAALVELCELMKVTARELDARIFFMSSGIPTKPFFTETSDC